MKRILPASPEPPRSRTLGQRTATGPMPVLNLALAMMTVANDTAPARIVLQIAVRRDEGRDLHLNGLRQETPRSRAQHRRQGILRK